MEFTRDGRPDGFMADSDDGTVIVSPHGATLIGHLNGRLRLYNADGEVMYDSEPGTPSLFD